MATIEIIGYVGNILLAVCALPTAIEAYINKKTSVPWSLLAPWSVGEVLVLIYVTSLMDYALMLNYGLNFIFLSTIIYFKIRSHNGEK